MRSFYFKQRKSYNNVFDIIIVLHAYLSWLSLFYAVWLEQQFSCLGFMLCFGKNLKKEKKFTLLAQSNWELKRYCLTKTFLCSCCKVKNDEFALKKLYYSTILFGFWSLRIISLVFWLSRSWVQLLKTVMFWFSSGQEKNPWAKTWWDVHFL